MADCRDVFLRALGGVYAVAFVSLGVQLPGLAGSRGILPCGWPDWTLVAVPFAAAALALAPMLGFSRAWIFAPLWIAWWLLVGAGQEFLAFQWDSLLIETGFLAILLASPRLARSRLLVWLFRALLFRLMFSSGVVKLASGDASWRRFTALQVHYETQPIPNPVAWYLHQLPAWFQTYSALLVFGVELAIPFLIFAPRPYRRVGAGFLVAFQLLIALTGNYAFFNLLTIALCILLWNDPPPDDRPRHLVTAVAALVLIGGAVQIAGLFIPRHVPRVAIATFAILNRFQIVNSYGLFAVMTTTRPEIVIEGSDDGQIWKEYEFTYKPGDLGRRPRFVAPHQPRLDWQMWFAALGGYESNPWFINLIRRLHEG
ncbi:MAG: lipase maturation factor family protein, partial [Bryobacteraceae bacterium]